MTDHEPSQGAALLPCPMCGHAKAPRVVTSAEWTEECDFSVDDDITNATYFAVMCSASKPNGPGGCGCSGGFGDTETAAIEKWNRRSAPAAADGGAEPPELSMSMFATRADYEAAIRAAAPSAVAPQWPLIQLGFGTVEVGEGRHEDDLALVFGREGTGTIGEATQPNREHKPCETLAVVTFQNVESVDVVIDKLNIIRKRIEGQQSGQQGDDRG